MPPRSLKPPPPAVTESVASRSRVRRRTTADDRPAHCQAVMIAFMTVHQGSVCHVTSREIRPHTATNDHERNQLQPELQPPMPRPLRQHGPDRSPPALQASNLRGPISLTWSTTERRRTVYLSSCARQRYAELSPASVRQPMHAPTSSAPLRCQLRCHRHVAAREPARRHGRGSSARYSASAAFRPCPASRS